MIRRTSPSSGSSTSPTPPGRAERSLRRLDREEHECDRPSRDRHDLHLASEAADGSRRPTPTPILQAGDPRWVLALRTADLLEGPVLTHDKRQRLLRLGRLMGLSPFSANLVIAIVQDRARRRLPIPQTVSDTVSSENGIRHRLGDDARADLALVPTAAPRGAGRWQTVAAVAALLVMQALVMLWLLR